MTALRWVGWVYLGAGGLSLVLALFLGAERRARDRAVTAGFWLTAVGWLGLTVLEVAR